MKEKINTYYKAAKKWFWALPVWKRAILSSVIGAIGGSSVIGFFNKYALYYHALRQNFRVPVEGVEYLDLAVTLLSFALLTVSILGTIMIYSTVNFTSNLVVKVFAKTASSTRALNLKSIFSIVQVLAIGITISTLLGGITFKQYLDDLDPGFDLSNLMLFIFSALSLIILLGFIFVRKEQARKIFTLVSVLIGVSLLTGSLFNQTIYKGFLKKIKYGGEIPIQIEYRKADNTQSLTKGLLLIKTNKSVTLRNIDSKNVEEIPIDRISKIIYESP
jgi:hypothetical protein